ncbi:IS3 family transposase [Streptomyces sp. NPDC087903]|uniref:IS3 family transposase n=1 Tax=Streptomyces sp. NPDC087903 TaxID=3365819 RepID=UPI003805C85A
MSESLFYKHRNRRPTGRSVRRQLLAEAVKAACTKSGGTYGSPKIWITLMRQGRRVSVNTVAKLMAELGLVARRVHRRSGAHPASACRALGAERSPPGSRWRTPLF